MSVRPKAGIARVASVGGAVTGLAASLLLLLLSATPARAAAIPAAHPDDICLPTDNPCVIDQEYEVQAPGSLDFGTRTVRIDPGGKLLRTVSITCGDFVVAVGATTVAVDTSAPGNVAGSLIVDASGAVTIDGTIMARGNPGGTVNIMADGPVEIFGRIMNDGSPVGSSGGTLDLRSYNSTVTTHDDLLVQSKKGSNLEAVEGGVARVIALGDVSIGAMLDAGGGDDGGTVTLLSQLGKVSTHGSVNASAGSGLVYGYGGVIEVNANAGIEITGSGPTHTQASRWTANGSTGHDTYYGKPYPGYGGYHKLYADGGDITIEEPVLFTAHTGPKAGLLSPPAGRFYAYADYGKVVIDGDLSAKGYGIYSTGGRVNVSGCEGVEIGDTATINVSSQYGGSVYIEQCQHAQSRIDGTVNVRGQLFTGYVYGLYGGYGRGGSFYFNDGDVNVGGSILGGADGGADGIFFDVCRLTAEQGARIDDAFGAPKGGGGVYFDIHESMTAEPGSNIRADAQGGGYVDIVYRDENKPPVLAGDTRPAPELSVNPLLPGCPVCGNGEIDGGETCDDGNTTSGDNCRDDCQDEGCLAETPGFPGVPICDDADPCTLDECNPVSHACEHVASCEEGVACTDDACVAGACEHTPVNAHCDDANDCTNDLCNTATGCEYETLTGNACEDGDLCTVTGTCDFGRCVATDESRAARNSAVFKLSVEPDDDRLAYKGQLPLAELTADPTATGLTIEVRDSSDTMLLSAVIPASSFQDTDGTGSKFRFDDKKHTLPTGGGVTQVAIQKLPAKGIGKVRIRAADVDLGGAADEFRVSVSMLFGTDPAVDECLTARFIPCEPKGSTNKCKDPK